MSNEQTSSHSIKQHNDHLGTVAVLGVGVIFAASKFDAPVWALPILGAVLGIPFAMARKRKFGGIRMAPFPLSRALTFLVLGTIIVGAFGGVVFIAKALLGFGPPNQRDLAILGAAILMMVVSSLVVVEKRPAG